MQVSKYSPTICAAFAANSGSFEKHQLRRRFNECSDRAIRARHGRRSRHLKPAQPDFPSMSHDGGRRLIQCFKNSPLGRIAICWAHAAGRHRAAHAFDRARNAYATCRRAPRVSAMPLQSADWSDARRPTTQCSPALLTGVPSEGDRTSLHNAARSSPGNSNSGATRLMPRAIINALNLATKY